MRVVQINCTYSMGSTGKITAAIHSYLRDEGHESYVIFGVGPTNGDLTVIKAAPEMIRKVQSFRSRITGFAYSGCLVGTYNIIRQLKRIKPDVVHLHCVNAYMVNISYLLTYLRENSISTVITLHAEFLYTAGCSHATTCTKWKTGCNNCDKIGKERPRSWFFDRSKVEWTMMRKAYSGFSFLVVCAVSDWVRDRAKQSPFFLGQKVVTVLNGLDISVFKPHNTDELYQHLKVSNEKVVLHVTPNFLNALKGGQHVIEMAKRFAQQNVRFIVVGCKGVDFPVPGNVQFIAPMDDQEELAAYYTFADVCLLTSVRETFSMVCAESLCCGTPVVGFKAGAPETITIPEYSEFVKQGDDNALEIALRYWLEKSYDAASIAEAAQQRYNQNVMCKNYYNIYTDICDAKLKRGLL